MSELREKVERWMRNEWRPAMRQWGEILECVRERDELRAEVERLHARLKEIEPSCPDRCDCCG